MYPYLDTPQYDSTIEEFNSTLIGNSSDMTQENLTLKQYFIMLEIADIVLPYALEAEDWFSVNRVSVGLLSIIEELKKDMDDNNHSWLYVKFEKNTRVSESILQRDYIHHHF